MVTSNHYKAPTLSVRPLCYVKPRTLTSPSPPQPQACPSGGCLTLTTRQARGLQTLSVMYDRACDRTSIYEWSADASEVVEQKLNQHLSRRFLDTATSLSNTREQTNGTHQCVCLRSPESWISTNVRVSNLCNSSEKAAQRQFWPGKGRTLNCFHLSLLETRKNETMPLSRKLISDL